MHQPMPDDDPGEGWDANGSPISEPTPTPTPRPLHPLMREQRAPHRCWICDRDRPHALCGMWLIALVIGNSGHAVRVWVCSSVCQEMALALMYGYVEVERWYHDHGYHGDAA